MNHIITAKNRALTAAISRIRRYIFVLSAQNFVWQSRQRYGERKSGSSGSASFREDRRTLMLLQFGHRRCIGRVGKRQPRLSGPVAAPVSYRPVGRPHRRVRGSRKR